jgi:hypothetical protein
MKGPSREFVVPTARVRTLRMGCGEPLTQSHLFWWVPQRPASRCEKARRERNR